MNSIINESQNTLSHTGQISQKAIILLKTQLILFFTTTISLWIAWLLTGGM